MSSFLRRFIFALIFIFLLAVPNSFAKGEAEKAKRFENLEVLTGFGRGKLQLSGNYHFFPVYFDYNFNLKKKETNARIFKQLHFVLEPFASYAFVPTDNLEAGVNFLLKVGFAEKKDKFQPYFKIGTGPMYMTKHTVEQSTQLNLNDNIGAGAHYYFKKDIPFTLEYRFRHISNASIKLPNVGVNSSIILFSLSYFF